MHQTLELINKTREYLDYVEEHCLNVVKAWKELKIKCKDMRFISDDFVFDWLRQEVMRHDFTKLSAEEFVQYRRHFYPCPFEQKGSLDEAWEHHKTSNAHHWEEWTKHEYVDPYEWEVHCVHMVIDWMAMGYKFGDTARQYYETNNGKINLPDYAEVFIYEIFNRIENLRDRQHETTPCDSGSEVSSCVSSGHNAGFKKRKAKNFGHR